MFVIILINILQIQMGSTSATSTQTVNDTHINNTVNNFKNTQSSDITHTTNDDHKHIVDGNRVKGSVTVIKNGANLGTQYFLLQNLYAGAHHLTAEQERQMHGDGDHMHGADSYLQNLYAGAHHTNGDEDHMHGADSYELQQLRFRIKHALSKVGHVAKKVVTNPTVQKIAIDSAIAAASAQQLI